MVGERILKMTPRLWFVHRGLERLAQGQRVEDVLALAERVSGDSAVAHSLGFVLAVEEAQGITVSGAQRAARARLLELERLTNHVADLGALCNDVGFSVAHARALVVRERLMRVAEELTGHRLLRGAIRPCVTTSPVRVETRTLREVRERLDEIVELALGQSIVRERFSGTAVLSGADARRVGALGVVARASGLAIDARAAHPFDVPRTLITQESGDVLARFQQRVAEAHVALDVLEGRDAELAVAPEDTGPSRDGAGLGLVEGWRGTVLHRVELEDAHVRRWRVVDPSFFNWPALALCLSDTIVPDFPLVNKSFNLSYAGNDL